MGPTLRALIEGFLRGRYGYEDGRVLRALASLGLPVLVGATLGVVGWLLLGPLLTIPRFTTEGPVVRNGVVAIVVCGQKLGPEGTYKATMDYVPEPGTGTWAPERRGECTVWYHRPPGLEQRHARQERAAGEGGS